MARATPISPARFHSWRAWNVSGDMALMHSTATSAAPIAEMASAMKSAWPGVSMTLIRTPSPPSKWNTCDISVCLRSFSSGSLLLMLEPSEESPWRLLTLVWKAIASTRAVLPLWPWPIRAMLRRFSGL